MSNVKYLEKIIGNIIADIKADQADTSKFSEFMFESKKLYERGILETLELWYSYFESPKPNNLPWIEQIFAANPKLAKDLITSLYALIVERERINEQALIQLSQDPEVDVSGEFLNNGEEHIAPKLQAIEHAFIAIESVMIDTLKDAHLVQGTLGVSSNMLIEHMNENAKNLFKGVKCSSLSLYKVVAAISALFLLCATGFMIYLYFTALDLLMVNFIESMIFSVSATAILAVNSVFMLRGFYQRRNQASHLAQIALSSANENEFEDIDLDDNKAGKRTHQFEMIRCLLQCIYSEIHRAPSTQHQGEEYHQNLTQHIERNEKTLTNLLDPLYHHFQSEAEKNVSWLDHLFAIKPKLAQQLIDKLLRVEEFRRDANLKIIAYSFASREEKQQKEAEMKRYIDRRHESIANLDREITALNKSVENLSTLCVQKRPEDADLYTHMSNNFTQVVQNKSNRDLKIHMAVQLVCFALIISSTGLMSYFYLSNQQSFFNYFIAAATVAVSSIFALCIDSCCIVKMVKKSDRIMASKHVFQVPDAARRVSTLETNTRVFSSFV